MVSVEGVSGFDVGRSKFNGRAGQDTDEEEDRWMNFIRT